MFVINFEKKIWDLILYIFIFFSYWIKYIYLIDLLIIVLYLKNFWVGINLIKLKLFNLIYYIFVLILIFVVWFCLYICICMVSFFLFFCCIVIWGKKLKLFGNFYLFGYNSVCVLCSVFIVCLWICVC